jgi:hypothetical protein
MHGTEPQQEAPIVEGIKLPTEGGEKGIVDKQNW